MANTLRVKSLNELGKGAWRVRENNQLPIPEPIHSQKKRSQRDSVRSIPQEKLWNAVLAIWPTRVISRSLTSSLPSRWMAGNFTASTSRTSSRTARDRTCMSCMAGEFCVIPLARSTRTSKPASSRFEKPLKIAD